LKGNGDGLLNMNHRYMPVRPNLQQQWPSALVCLPVSVYSSSTQLIADDERALVRQTNQD
jgi:hypothetical protein